MKRKLDDLFLSSIMESENEKRTDGKYNTMWFSVYPAFILQEKKENGYNRSYFYFSFFV